MAAADDSTPVVGVPADSELLHDKTVAIIGGSGLLKTELPVFSQLEKRTVATSAGNVVVRVGKLPSKATLVFVQRHDAREDGEYTQPADINYQAIALALKELVSSSSPACRHRNFS